MRVGRIHLTDHQKALKIDRRRIRAAVCRALRSEGCEKEVSVVFVGNEEIRDLNERYLKHNRETDVIAFPLEDDRDDLLGEVIVSTEVAIREAKKRGLEPMEEAILYAVHGVLHLLGYDDTDPASRRRMRKKERDVIRGPVPN